MAIGWLFENPRVPPRAVDEVALQEEAQAFEPEGTLAELTKERLAELASERGCDLATAVLYDRVKRDPEHGAFIRDVDSVDLAYPRRRLRGRLLVVPAAFYKELPGPGGDGALVVEVAERLGLSASLATLSSTGLVTENAAALERVLDDEPYPVAVVSMSKGGADVRVALTEEPALTRKIRVWVQIGGLVRGSPLLDELLESSLPARLLLSAYFSATGGSLALLRELSARPGSLLSRAFRAPEGLAVVNVLGFPLSSHLAGNVAARHARLARLGPNDGSTLLRDAIVEPGLVYPVWGADHYFRLSGASALLYRLFLCLARRGVLAS